MIEKPVVVGVRGDVRPLVRVGAEVEYLGNPQVGERFRPDAQRAGSPLLQEHELPVVVAQCGQLLVVVDVEERLARAFRDLPGQVGDQVVAVEMDLVGHVAHLVALEQLLLHLRVAGHRQQGRQPVEVGDDVVGHAARLDLARPADHGRHPVGAFPVRVLLAAERRHAASGQEFMCGPLSVLYMTKVLSAMPRSSIALSTVPTFLSWSIIVS